MKTPGTFSFDTKRELVGARPLHLAVARPFCHLKAPLGLSLLRKREPEKCQRFRRAGSTKKGLLAPFNPKAVGCRQKYWRFTPVRRENLLIVFLPFANLNAPQSLRDSSPKGSGLVTTPPVKMRLERPAGRDKREYKNIYSTEHCQSAAEAI